ncbi:FkbM family methyltransferase [Mycobacterium sp. AMU20-3851]|uniref:FkbM family methyltransferase n=1 Tax=Mycobacterium sp. AMU20-3851 TaxID=3122055 RepID=UPI0037541EEE
MQVAGRSIGKIAGSVLQRRHYVAARNMIKVYEHPVDIFRRYLSGSGDYPTTVRLRTPLGWVSLQLYTAHDLLTVNEIFCRSDYQAGPADRVIVDFGSNIGISAAYFLSRNPDAFVYLFEPLPRNIARLQDNLRPFEGRYALQEVAVSTAEGEVEFGWEETGRYGGVDAAFGNSLTVKSVDSQRVLRDVVDKHGHIDILKIDIEGLESAVINHIPADLAAKIDKLYVEYVFDHNPLATTHTLVQYGDIAQFTLIGG